MEDSEKKQERREKKEGRATNSTRNAAEKRRRCRNKSVSWVFLQAPDFSGLFLVSPGFSTFPIRVTPPINHKPPTGLQTRPLGSRLRPLSHTRPY